MAMAAVTRGQSDAPGMTSATWPAKIPEASETPESATVVHRMRQWCQRQPNKALYTWLDDAGREEVTWTYRDLEMRADAVCHALHHLWGCEPGDRAVLMYLPGLDFIAGFFGCLFAGVIGGGTFVAGNVSLQCYRVDAWSLEFACTEVGRGVYIGNSAVVALGCTCEDFVTIGDFSVVHPSTALARMDMLVGKSRIIPRSVVGVSTDVENQMESVLDYRPTIWSVLARLFLTILFLFTITASLITAFEVMFQVQSDVGDIDGLGFFDPNKFFGQQPAQFCFLWRPLVASIMFGALGIAAFLSKWLLLGRVAVGSHHPPHEMDSLFFLLYWLCCMCWGLFAALLGPFSGTPLVSFAFTLMGANVGSEAQIFSVFVLCDFDAFRFEEGAFIGEGLYMQCHSFLNGGLVFGRILIEDNALAVGLNSVFVSDTTLASKATLGPCSTIMRGDTVAAGELWHGNPAVKVSNVAAQMCNPQCVKLAAEPATVGVGTNENSSNVSQTFLEHVMRKKSESNAIVGRSKDSSSH